MPSNLPREPRLSHDRRILLMAFASAAPGAVISLIFLWTGDFTPKVQWTLSVLIVTVCLGFALALRERVVLPLQTLSNLLAALGEGDFSIRARGARGGDPLGEVMIEVNALVETLRHQRLDALEATTLLRKVMAEIDVAVFTFDEEHELKFVNFSASPPNGCSAGVPPTSTSPIASPAMLRASSTRRFPAASADGRSDAASSGRVDVRTSCSCSPTSANRSATRSARPGSG